MSDELAAWQADNHQFNVGFIDILHLRLRAVVEGNDPAIAIELDAAVAAHDERARALTVTPALVTLAATLGLDDFQRDVALLAFGYEIDGRFTQTQANLTVGTALRVVPGAHWAAFDPSSPLRRWDVVEIERSTPLVDATIRLSADITTFLLGLPMRPVSEAFHPAPQPRQVVESGLDAAADLVALLEPADGTLPVAVIHGADRDQRRVVATIASAALGRHLELVDLGDLPATGPDLDRTLRHWARNAELLGRALLVEHGELDAADRTRLHRVAAALGGPLFVSSPTGSSDVVDRPVVRQEATFPDPVERLEVWRHEVGPVDHDGDVQLSSLAEHYRFGVSAIEQVCAEARATSTGDDAVVPALAAASRRRTRAAIEHLADRLDVDHLDRLVLPERQLEELEEFEAHIRHAYLVNTTWGLGEGHGRGVSALFAGPSGTGKTLAAKSLGHRLGLDVYRVDLSAVVSKYIGETEKNLAQLFDAAEAGGSVLLFDEADAVFGKRSDVKDSHDRYANLEVSYLLQRMETSAAPSVLTTNIRDAIDPAFVRRLRFIVEFPFPDEEARAAIWASLFPAATPVEGIEPDRLARLVVNGATIRNIAVRAAFLAADTSHAIGMADVLEATRRELRKVGRDLPVEEVADWLT